MSPSQQQRGFVLLMTLALIVLAGTLLTGFARHSLSVAVAAQTATTDLQLKWGRISCSRVLLPDASRLLRTKSTAAAEEEIGDGQLARSPRSHIDLDLKLGELDFSLLLADEDSKIDVNTLDVHMDAQVYSSTLRQLLRKPEGMQLRVRSIAPRTNRRRRRRLHSWGQVFEFANPGREIELPEVLRKSTVDLTCWGSGKLNFRTARPVALRKICQLGGDARVADELLQARAQSPLVDLRTLLKRAGVNSRKRREYESLLSSNSSTYSLWMTARFGQQRWDQLDIGVSNGQQSRIGFNW